MNKVRYHICFAIMLISLMACDNDTKVKNVTITTEHIVLDINETIQAEVIVSPISAISYNKVFWSSDNEDVAVVDNNGYITGIYAGECNITANCGGISGTCKVFVQAKNIECTFQQAYAISKGDISECGTNHITLIMAEKDMIIDTTTCTVTGQGSYMILESESEWDVRGIKDGEYIGSPIVSSNTFLPATEYGQYAGGSYLCVNKEGETVVVYPITNGNFIIHNNDKSDTINGVFNCLDNEHVSVKYNGNIIYISPYKTHQYNKQIYEKSEFHKNGSIGENNICELTLSDKDGNKCKFNLILPLSTNSNLPVGKYILRDKIVPYTIISEQIDKGMCAVYISADEKTKQIISGTLNIENINGEQKYSANFIDENGMIYDYCAE